MAGSASPTARRRRLGFELRRLREAAGLKLDQVAARLELTGSTLSRIETGRSPCRTTYLVVMLDMYGVTDPEQIQILKDMARQGQRKGWWAGYDDALPTGFGIYVGLETEASFLRAYEAQGVHGLLQTPDYARAVLRAWDWKASTERIDRQIELRIRRQDVLTRPDSPLELWVILDEAALRREVGGPDVMRAQFRRLIAAAEMPNLTVQVLPFSQGAHAGFAGSFYIIDFPGGDPSVTYAESSGGNIYLEKPHEVRRWAEAFDQLRAQALSPDDSRQMVAKLSPDT